MWLARTTAPRTGYAQCPVKGLGERKFKDVCVNSVDWVFAISCMYPFIHSSQSPLGLWKWGTKLMKLGYKKVKHFTQVLTVNDMVGPSFDLMLTGSQAFRLNWPLSQMLLWITFGVLPSASAGGHYKQKFYEICLFGCYEHRNRIFCVTQYLPCGSLPTNFSPFLIMKIGKLPEQITDYSAFFPWTL